MVGCARTIYPLKIHNPGVARSAFDRCVVRPAKNEDEIQLSNLKRTYLMSLNRSNSRIDIITEEDSSHMFPEGISNVSQQNISYLSRFALSVRFCWSGSSGIV